uniref:DUF4371 domain-containing protein n=1 Tax=Amphimedon queenslandica TaxID=400682 RepID=A0A1X7VAH9_AMPQE
MIQMREFYRNQILDFSGSTIVFRIMEKLKKATYYTVMADEVTECSNKEQLSLALMYVNPEDNLIYEDFVPFIEFSLFFGAHAKRQTKLGQAIDESQPESKVIKLKDSCCTRWVERIDTFDCFNKILPSLVSGFESASAEGTCCWHSNSLTDSSTLFLAICTTEFLSALVITSTSLNYVMALTKYLQSEAKDIVQAVSDINNVLQVFKGVRKNVDLNHNQSFAEVEPLGKSIGKELSLPRICGRQAYRSDVASNTPMKYYQRTITIPLY